MYTPNKKKEKKNRHQRTYAACFNMIKKMKIKKKRRKTYNIVYINLRQRRKMKIYLCFLMLFCGFHIHFYVYKQTYIPCL